MRNTKIALTLVTLASLQGCAIDAKINEPLANPALQDFAGQPIVYHSTYKSIDVAEGEVNAALLARTNKREADLLQVLDGYIRNQLPGAKKATGKDSDDAYQLRVSIKSNTGYGPAYRDYLFFPTLGSKLLTLNLGPYLYDIRADFDVEYVVTKQGKEVFRKVYEVRDSVGHQRGAFTYDPNEHELRRQEKKLFRKHFEETLGDFARHVPVTP